MNDNGGVTIRATFAWGILFLVFIAMTDIPETGMVAAAFAWLLLVAVAMKYGPTAFDTISSFNTPTVSSSAGGTGGKVL